MTLTIPHIPTPIRTPAADSCWDPRTWQGHTSLNNAGDVSHIPVVGSPKSIAALTSLLDRAAAPRQARQGTGTLA